MNILQKIIATLNKEESRFYKLFTSRTSSNKERKDVLLFDYIKRNNEDYDENFIAKKLYKENKNTGVEKIVIAGINPYNSKTFVVEKVTIFPIKEIKN